MIIANPLYDTAFKYMMDNDRVVKFFISTIIGETVESVRLRPQEYTHVINKDAERISLYRLDFIANVKTDYGYRKVLIEVQKSQDKDDIFRFRKYLGQQYQQEDDMEDGTRNCLPIITIYILGFNLLNVQSPCFRVGGSDYVDMVSGMTIKSTDELVSKLTHISYFIQTKRIENRYVTQLDKLLSLFEQNHFINNEKILKDYLYSTDVDEIVLMRDRLHYAGINPQHRKELEDEQEAWRILDVYLTKRQNDNLAIIETQKQALEQKDQALEQKEVALEQEKTKKEQALAENAKKDQALIEKDQAMTLLLKELEILRKKAT